MYRLTLILLFVFTYSLAQDHTYDPPWNTPPESKVMFTIPGVDNVPDLFGDITDPQLVIFFAGNQFMCIDDLLAALKNNPHHITSLKDLGRKDVRVSMPNPEWDGIGRRIEDAYVKAGGAALKQQIMQTKVQDKSTYLTQIHHRQSPMRILYKQSDAAPVWYAEAYYQELLHHPVRMIAIPDKENIQTTYIAGRKKNAPHEQAAKDFMQFLNGAEARAVYRKYGFSTLDF